MIFGRIVAGMGGGGLMSISTFVSSDLIPLRKRGLWQGFGNIFYGLGSGVGGVFGGWINDTLGWRWAFLIQVPVIVVSTALVFFVVKIPIKETQKSRIKRVDFLGSFLLIASLVLLLLGLNSGGNVVPWNHPLVLVSLPLSALFLLAFIYVEDRIASEPVIPVRLLLDRTVASACLTNWLATMAVFGLLYYAPIYFQVLGLSSTQAGIRLIPNAVGAGAGSLGVGVIMRATGKYWLLSSAMMLILVAAQAIVTGTFNDNAPEWIEYVALALNGLGYGGMLTITLLALISAVSHADQAVATSASYAFRSTGSTIGITIAGSVFQNMLKKQLHARLDGMKGADEIIARLRDSIDEIKNVPSSIRDDVLQAYIVSLRSVWAVLLGLAVLSLVVSLGMRENVLHKNLARK